MMLAARHFDFRARRLFWPLAWRDGLGVVPMTAVIPHYDFWPEAFSAAIVLQAPRGVTTLGVDEETAAVGRDGSWQVQGNGRVTVWRGRHRERFRSGDAFRI
jgi:cyanophycinase-like exopeptidase